MRSGEDVILFRLNLRYTGLHYYKSCVGNIRKYYRNKIKPINRKMRDDCRYYKMQQTFSAESDNHNHLVDCINNEAQDEDSVCIFKTITLTWHNLYLWSAHVPEKTSHVRQFNGNCIFDRNRAILWIHVTAPTRLSFLSTRWHDVTEVAAREIREVVVPRAIEFQRWFNK